MVHYSSGKWTMIPGNGPLFRGKWFIIPRKMVHYSAGKIIHYSAGKWSIIPHGVLPLPCRCHQPQSSILSSHRSRILSSHRLSNRMLSSHRSRILSSHRPHNRIVSCHRSHNLIFTSDCSGFSKSLNSIGKTILSVNVFACTIKYYKTIVPE